MASKATDARIRASVDAFVEQLSTLIRASALESVQEALGGSLPQAARKPGRPKGSTSRKAATRRTPSGRSGRRSAGDVEATQAQVLAFVKANDKCSVADVAASMGVSTKELQLPMRKLVEEGKLKTSGQRRGTRYHTGSGRAPRKSTPRKSTKKAVRRKSTKKKVTRRKKA